MSMANAQIIASSWLHNKASTKKLFSVFTSQVKVYLESEDHSADTNLSKSCLNVQTW